MKKQLIICSLLLLSTLCFAQPNYTPVTATIVDPSGQAWAFGNYSVDFQRSPSNQGTIPLLVGVPFVEHGIVGNLDIAGTFALALPDVSKITPSGGQWIFTICPNASSQCYVIPTGNRVSGPPQNLSVFLNSNINNPVVSTTNINRAYKDAEVTPVKGGFYYDIINNCIKFSDGTTFTCTGGGGGGGPTLQVNGVNNGSQTLLNLIQGTNITITDNGVGGVTITAAGGGGGTPGGSDTQVQFNDSSAFGGAADVTYNKSIIPGELDPKNINNISYVTTAFNWSQTPAGTLTAGVPATVTLTPCPDGIDGRDSIGKIWISGVGTPEPVKMTGGGSCRPHLGSGTINFTPLNSHGAGYTIGSGSSGIYEAIAVKANWTGVNGKANAHIILKPAGDSASNMTYAYRVQASIIPSVNSLTIDGGGALLSCETRDACISVESINGLPVTIRDLRMASNTDVNGWAISQTECSASTTTIHTTLPHGIVVGDLVDVQRTDDGHYWGGSMSQNGRVTAVTANTVSWFDNNCGAGAGGSRALVSTPGYINVVNASIFTTEQGTTLENLSFDIPGGSAGFFHGHFNNHVVVMNDQAFRWTGSNGVGLTIPTVPHDMCTTNFPYCGAMLYMPGSFSNGPSVGWIKNVDFSPQCAGNPIVAYNGNTLLVQGGVAQGQAQTALNIGNRRGGFGTNTLTDVYVETGGCTNPDTGTANTAGLITYGRTRWTGGEGPQGVVPVFATGGGTTYYYYLLATDATAGTSAPMFFGSAAPTVNTFDVYFPRVQPTSGFVGAITYTNPTYTVVRTTNANVQPYTGICSGGSTSACGSVLVSAAQCAGLFCHFTDDVTISTAAVSIPTNLSYVPLVSFWPGPVVIEGNGTFSFDNLNGTPDIIDISGIYKPTAFTLIQETSRTHAWIQTLSGGGGNATLLDESGVGNPYLNTKGRINLNRLPSSVVPQAAYITLVDSDPVKTVNTASKRPLMDANDVYIGNDVANATLTTAGLAFNSPTSITNYVGKLPDGLNFIERLTAAQKEFNVPVQMDQTLNVSLSCKGCSAFDRTSPPISDTLNRAIGPIGANWNILLGSYAITNGGGFPAFVGINYASADVIVNEGGINRAYGYYSATSFTDDQYAQAVMAEANGVFGICVRMANATPITAYCFTSGSNSRTLVKFVAGAITNLVSLGAPNIPNGSVIKIQAIGAIISVYQNGALLASTTDSAIKSGSPGFYTQNFVTSLQGASNFYAGNAGWTATEGLTMTSLSPLTLVDGATITWNLKGYSLQNATVTLAGNRTLNLTNPASGGNYTLRVVQDGAGGHTLTLGTGCTWKVFNGGAGAITLSVGANAIDVLTFYYDGANCYANLGLNYN